jgi:predicted outer membrane protein
MRLVLVTAAAIAALSSAAVAQSSGSTGSATPPNSNASQNNMTGSSNPAVDVKPKGSPESTGSVEPGANSFTEGQARSRIEAQGFANVTDLKKDDQGLWRGRAQRNGQSVNVTLDYKGNVATQ